jgi:hypothetical protein
VNDYSFYTNGGYVILLCSCHAFDMTANEVNTAKLYLGDVFFPGIPLIYSTVDPYAKISLRIYSNKVFRIRQDILYFSSLSKAQI